MMRIEAWVALDGSASRELTQLGPGGAVLETVVRGRRAAVYSQRDDRLTLYERVARRAPSGLCWPCLVAELDRIVRRALLRPEGDAVIDGREVAVLRLAGATSARLFIAKAGGGPRADRGRHRARDAS
jgi:hypothetical protein